MNFLSIQFFFSCKFLLGIEDRINKCMSKKLEDLRFIFFPNNIDRGNYSWGSPSSWCGSVSKNCFPSSHP